MRAFAMTGIVTASWIPLMRIGSDMRATPPSRRMSAGARSSAITAAAPASSAILACSALTTSMITPPLSISASPALTRNVDSSRMPAMVATAAPTFRTDLLEAERPDAVVVLRRVAGVDPVGQRLQDRQQTGVRAHEGRGVRGVVERALRELGDLGQRRVDDRQRRSLAVAGDLHRAHDQRMRAAGAEADHERLAVDVAEPRERLLRR